MCECIDQDKAHHATDAKHHKLIMHVLNVVRSSIVSSHELTYLLCVCRQGRSAWLKCFTESPLLLSSCSLALSDHLYGEVRAFFCCCCSRHGTGSLVCQRHCTTCASESFWFSLNLACVLTEYTVYILRRKIYMALKTVMMLEAFTMNLNMLHV